MFIRNLQPPVINVVFCIPQSPRRGGVVRLDPVEDLLEGEIGYLDGFRAISR